MSVLLRLHIGNPVVPLRLISFDIDKLPGVQRAGIRIHALDVWLLHPVGGVRTKWYERLCVEQKGFGFGQQIKSPLGIKRAIRFVRHSVVLWSRPTRAIFTARTKQV